MDKNTLRLSLLLGVIGGCVNFSINFIVKRLRDMLLWPPVESVSERIVVILGVLLVLGFLVLFATARARQKWQLPFAIFSGTLIMIAIKGVWVMTVGS